MGAKLRHTSAKNEETLFSLQFSIVLVEHLRLIAHVLHKRHEITPSEYSILVVLDTLALPIDVTTIMNYLAFKRGTLLAILTSLEEYGLIHKETDSIDERRMLVRLSAEGHRMARMLSSEVAQLMSETFWRSHPTRDYLAPLQELEAHLERVRGFAVPDIPLNRSISGLTHALLFRVIRLVVDEWTRAIKQHSSLNFNEARVLLLLEHFGELAPGDIAHRLLLARSGVSLQLTRLQELNLVGSYQNYEDARGKVYRCTTSGLRLSRELFAVLRKTTCDAYGNYSDEATITLNEQHMGMYRDLGHVQSVLEAILEDSLPIT